MPASVNLIAFAIKLVKICRTRSTSQRTSGRSSGSFIVMCRSFAVASGVSASTIDVDLRREVDVLGVHLEMPRFDARQIEDVVDQAQQRASVARDDLEISALIAGQRSRDAVAQQLREREDRVERRADLVAHVRR